MFSLPPLLAHIIELALVALFSAIALGVGLRLLRLLGLTSALSVGERFLFGIALGYGVLAFVMLAMGLLGIVYRPLALVLLAVLLIIGFEPLWREAALLRGAVRHSLGALYPPNVFLALVILVAIGAALSKALVPVATQDDLMYHLALPRLYVEQHAVTFHPDSTYSLFPQLMEMLYTWGLLVGSDRVSVLFAFEMGLLGPAAAALFAKRYLIPEGNTGLWRALPLLVAAFSLTTPLAAFILRAANTDLAQASFDMLAVYAFFLAVSGRWSASAARASGQPSQMEPIRNPGARLLVLAGLCSGLSFSVKYYGFAVGLCLGLALLALVVVGYARKRDYPRLSSLLYFGVPALLLAAPWLIRNYITAANPIWPLGGALFGGAYWSADASPEELLGKAPGFDLSNIWTGLDFMRTAIIRGPWAIGGQEHVVSLGPLLIPALAALPLAIWRPVLRLVTYVALVYWLLWAFFFSRTSARYLSSFFLFAALLGAFAVVCVAERFRLTRWTVAGVLTLALTILSVEAALSTGPYLPTALSLDRADEQRFLATYMEEYSVIQFIASSTPPDATIYVWDGQPRGYYIPRRYVYARLVPLYSRFADTPTAWRARLAELGITHILVHARDFLAPGQPIYTDPDLPAEQAFASRYFGPLLAQAGDYELYALK